MLTRAMGLIDYAVECLDGYGGILKDLYFDDWEWNVRYLVVELADPESNLRTLIAPASVSRIDREMRRVFVSLHLEKIRNSPEVDTDLPISRQYEIALRRYYEWPEYWENTSFLDSPRVKYYEDTVTPLDDLGRSVEGRSDNLDLDEEQVSDTSMEPMPLEPDDDEEMDMGLGRSEESVSYNPRLRSFIELRGYRVQATDSDAASIDDLVVDDKEWNIAYVAVKLHNSREGKQVLLTLHWVDTISWGTTRLFSSLTQSQLEKAPAFNGTTDITREYEQQVFDYYDSL